MSGDDDDFAAMFAASEQAAPKGKQRRPKVGDHVRGKVVSIGKDAVFVDLGGKAEGILDREQVLSKDGSLRVAVGDEVDARVVEDKGGALILKVRLGGRGPEARAELQQAFELAMPVEGKVTEVIKGGLSVDVGGVRGFVPASQADIRFTEDLSPLVGRTLTFRITQYQPGPRGNLVLSRRAVLEEERAANRAENEAKLQLGLVMRGTITSIKPYGAFVDLGGLEGMLHVSELRFGRVGRPEDVVSVGQEVTVVVIKLEPSEDPKKPLRISLSLKALETDPWLEHTKDLVVGSSVRGKVTKLKDFGAFVEIAPGVEGLVHISELGAGRRINHPKEVVKAGDEVEAVILQIDPEKHRIGLSMAASHQAEEQANVAEHGRKQVASSAKLGTFGDLLAKATQGEKAKK